MTISKDNEQVKITMSKELKLKLKNIADEHNRSLSNTIVNIVDDYVKNTHDNED